jgi:RhoGAP domain
MVLIVRCFADNAKSVAQLLKSADISAVTALLKMYFRQLPEPLFPFNFYRDFVNAMSMQANWCFL